MAWQELAIESAALRGNALGDPSTRPLFVWTPPGYDDSDRRYPSIYLLHAMTGQARAWFNVSPFAPSFPEVVEGLGLEAIIVAVDGFTALGGAQWIDSPAIGDYGRYFCEDVVGLVDARFRTLSESAHRGVAGKSSGGFGAMVWAMLRPDLFGGFASHAGDALFECLSLRSSPRLHRRCGTSTTVRSTVSGTTSARAAGVRQPGRSAAPERLCLRCGLFARARRCGAALSPRHRRDRAGGVRALARVGSGAPCPTHAEALRGLRAVWIDAGRNDEYRLDLGAVAFLDAIETAGASEVHFELFDGGHRGLNRRFSLSLPFLAQRLALEA